MNIVVCVKQVPDTTTVKINPETNTLMREGVKSIINPFDLYAIEEALRLREKHGGKVTVISMGPPQAQEALRGAIALGVDDAVLLSDRAFAGADTWATSYALAKGIQKLGSFDLIICGKQAIDGDTAQVGPGIAVNLDIPQVTYVRKVNEVNDGKMVVERMTEEGYDKIEVTLPAMLTVVKEINEPRMESLKGKMRAKKAEIPVWSANDIGAEPGKIGLAGSPTKVVRIFSPELRVNGEMLEGSVEDQAAALVKKLREANLV